MRPVVFILAGILLLCGPPQLPTSWTLPDVWTIVAPRDQVTAAVYVFEKDEGSAPPFIESALDRLNSERKIVATSIDDDLDDGRGEIPAQYRTAIPAAREAGLPAFVILAGDRVLRVTKPKTEDEAWRDAQ